MSWNMYNSGGFGGGRNQGNQGFRGGFNPQQGGSSGGYGRGNMNNFRGGFRQGDRNDYFVNDEVVGSGGGGYQRKAPPAHSGSNLSMYGAGRQHFTPPDAHTPGFQGFQGYGQYGYTGAGYNTWNYNQGNSSLGKRNFNTRSSSDEEKVKEKEEQGKEKEIFKVTKVENRNKDKKEDKTSLQESRTSEPNQDNSSGTQTSSKISSQTGTSLSTPASSCSLSTPINSSPPAQTNSRRKQYTPQKVPVGPGGGTMSIITQKGLILDQEKDASVPEISVTPAKISEISSVTLEKKTRTAEIVHGTTEKNMVTEEAVTGTTEKKTISSEGDLADKDTDDDVTMFKQKVRKKRMCKLENKVESDSDEGKVDLKSSPSKTRSGGKSPRQSKPQLPTLNLDQEAVSSESRSTEDREADMLENPVIPKLREDLDTPQRRRSKGEMKAFPGEQKTASEPVLDSKPLTIQSPADIEVKPKKVSVDETIEKTSEPSETPRRTGRRKDAKTPEIPNVVKDKTNKEVFKQVEEDMEAMFAGISSPEKSAPPEPEIEPQPEPERKSPRSKRKSAQTAELKIRENQSEDYNLFQSPIKPKPLKETPKSAKEFNTTTKPVPNSFVSPRSKRLSAMTKVEVPVMNTEVETKEEKESNDSKDDKESKKNCSTEKIVPAKSSVSNTKPKRTASKPLQYRLVDETAVSEDSVDPTDIPEVKSLEGGRRSRRSRGSVSDPVTPAKDADSKPDVIEKTPEVRLTRKRMASVSLDESDESGTPATPAPVKKSKRLSSTPQEAEVVQGDATTQKKTLEMTLSESEAKEEFHQSRTTDSLGRSALGPPEIQIIEKDVAESCKKKVKLAPSKQKHNEEKKRGKRVEEDPAEKLKKIGKGRGERKGPYVHIEGDFRSPRTVVVVNSASDGAESKQKGKRGIIDAEHRARTANFGHVSVHSKQYDYKTVDDTWRCIFCQQKSHYRGLGDLFGPYFIPSACIKPDTLEKKNRPKRKSLTSEDGGEAEIWFHEDCFCWVPGVFLVGSRIMGMDEAVSLCRETKCTVCKEPGASLGCTRTSCRTAVHVPCSLDQPWQTDIFAASATCPTCVKTL